MYDSVIEMGYGVPLKLSAFLDHICVRPSTSEDFDVLKELYSISFPVEYDDNFYCSLNAKYYKGQQLIVWIAEYRKDTESIPVGCIVMQERPLDGSVPCELSLINGYMYNTVLYVLNIAVFPKYKRKGVGSLLLQKSIEAANRNELCAGVYLHVLASNVNNIRFYEYNGFQFVQEFPDFYLIDGKLESSKLFFFSLHGAVAGYHNSSDTLNITTVVLAVVFLSILFLSGYKAIKE